MLTVPPRTALVAVPRNSSLSPGPALDGAPDLASNQVVIGGKFDLSQHADRAATDRARQLLSEAES